MLIRPNGMLSLPVMLAMSACSLFGENKYDQSTPPEGSVERRMTRSPEEISRGATEALQELGMTVEQDQHDALGGRLLGERATPAKDEVIIWYKSLDPKTTNVAVKVGSGDRHLADMILDRIAQYVGTAASRAVPTVGASTEGLYDQPVAQCVTIMEQALRDLKLNVTHHETHDTWTQLDSREADSIPLSVRLDRTEKDKTRVRISAGTTQNQDTQQMADRVKAQFEDKLNQASSVK